MEFGEDSSESRTENTDIIKHISSNFEKDINDEWSGSKENLKGNNEAINNQINFVNLIVFN